MSSKTSITRTVIVESKPGAITKAFEWILSKLQAGNFSAEDVFAVRMALSEAFLNAISHGNKMDPDKEIKIDYSVSEDKVGISMTDQGEGFNPQKVPDPRCDENLYKTRGRGLLLMRSYMDVVEFNELGNSVHMVRYKNSARSAANSKDSNEQQGRSGV
ncbi:MAG TPA: ATP-binding protein [Sedimentisphaerales bacterium]|nr:ATP-binding protein [Sedimentisphaerales bacterium]